MTEALPPAANGRLTVGNDGRRERKSAGGKERALRDMALFLVAVTHGLRASEVGNLQIADMHITEGRGTIRITIGARHGVAAQKSC